MNNKEYAVFFIYILVYDSVSLGPNELNLTLSASYFTMNFEHVFPRMILKRSIL